MGFSFAHVTPVFDGRVVRAAVRRVNLGGKALTNYLKELVSYRQWNMMDEYFLVDDVKEKLCYVASDADAFEAELRRARVRIRRRRARTIRRLDGSNGFGEAGTFLRCFTPP